MVEAREVSSDLTGSKFGPYRIVRRLGVGGMAETFEAVRSGPGEFSQRVCLKLALPFFTLKDVIFLGNAGYHLLFLFSLLEIFNLILPTRKSLWVMIFLCTAFSGLDWFVNTIFIGWPFVCHHEWWQKYSSLDGDAQITSYFISLWWCFHHFAGFLACVLSFITLSFFHFKNKKIKYTVSGSLLISAFYSSVFVVIPALLFCLAKFKVLARRLMNIKVLPFLLFLFLAPLSIYVKRMSVGPVALAGFRIDFTGIFYLDKIISFPVWLILVSGIEFCFIPFIIALFFKKLSKNDKIYFFTAAAYFISTYVIYFTTPFNLYSMRGMFLPAFVFFYLFSKYLPAYAPVNNFIKTPRGLMAIIFTGIFLSLGTLSEIIVLARRSILNMALTHKARQGFIPKKIFPVNYRDISRNQSLRFYSSGHRHSAGDYNAEKMMHLPLEDMLLTDKEILGVATK